MKQPNPSYHTFHTLRLLKKLTDKTLKDAYLRPILRITLIQLKKDIRATISFLRNAKQRSSKNQINFGSDKLQIGGGKCYLTNFVNLDIFPPADVIWDCRYGLPFKCGTFSFVFSEHFLEHLDFPMSSNKVLYEIYRVLKPGGELFLGVPDAGKLIKAYYTNNKFFLNNLKKRVYKKRHHPPLKIYGNMDLINYIFRDQLDSLKYTTHYWAYDENNLTNLLYSTGFRIVKKVKFDNRYCNPKRKFYTLYVKAIK